MYIRCFKRIGGMQSAKSTQLALDLNTSNFTICSYLKKIGKVTKLGIWLLHTLSEKNNDHISIVTNFPSRQKNDLFLKYIITGNENRSSMAIFNAKSSGLTRMNLSSLPQRWRFKEEKFCCVYGGINAELFILSF